MSTMKRLKQELSAKIAESIKISDELTKLRRAITQEEIRLPKPGDLFVEQETGAVYVLTNHSGGFYLCVTSAKNGPSIGDLISPAGLVVKRTPYLSIEIKGA